MWYASFKAKDGIPEEVIADSHRKSGIEDHSTHAHDSLSPGRRLRCRSCKRKIVQRSHELWTRVTSAQCAATGCDPRTLLAHERCSEC